MAHSSHEFRFEQLHLAQGLPIGAGFKLADMPDQQDSGDHHTGTIGYKGEESAALFNCCRTVTPILARPAQYQEGIPRQECLVLCRCTRSAMGTDLDASVETAYPTWCDNRARSSSAEVTSGEEDIGLCFCCASISSLVIF